MNMSRVQKHCALLRKYLFTFKSLNSTARQCNAPSLFSRIKYGRIFFLLYTSLVVSLQTTDLCIVLGPANADFASCQQQLTLQKLQ